MYKFCTNRDIWKKYKYIHVLEPRAITTLLDNVTNIEGNYSLGIELYLYIKFHNMRF